jgi:hypothetical protein
MRLRQIDGTGIRAFQPIGRHGRRDRRGHGHVRDHDLGHDHGPRGPSGPRGISSLDHSGRSADGSNKPRERADAPSVLQSNGSGGRLEPSTHLPSSNLDLVQARSAHSGSVAELFLHKQRPVPIRECRL